MVVLNAVIHAEYTLSMPISAQQADTNFSQLGAAQKIAYNWYTSSGAENNAYGIQSILDVHEK